MVDWDGVRDRVRALADNPRSHTLFGANGHDFQLHDPLSSADIAAVETQFGAQLPDEYRAFLGQVGAGGAGPFYGIFPLIQSGGLWRWEGDGAGLTATDRLAEPFPASPIDPHALAALLAEQPNEEADDDLPDDYDAVYEAWDSRVEALLWHPDRTVGAICLCHEGCAYRNWLIVSGPGTGTIWSDPRTDFSDLSSKGTTFRSWYLEWLGPRKLRFDERRARRQRPSAGHTPRQQHHRHGKCRPKPARPPGCYQPSIKRTHLPRTVHPIMARRSERRTDRHHCRVSRASYR